MGMMDLLPSSEGFALQTPTLFARENYVEQAWLIVETVLKSKHAGV